MNKRKNNSNYKKNIAKKYYVIGITSIVIITGFIITYPYIFPSNETESPSGDSNILGDWHDIHGVGISKAGDTNDDNSILYLATHNGLYNKQENSTWNKVGNDRSDLMGFVINPNKEGVMYSSGHPIGGGNLGFRMSVDGGMNWQDISPVTDIPIDFHAMSISPVNDNILYGSPGGGNDLYISQDEGKTWSIIMSIPSQIISIAADPIDSNGVYIGTRSGLFYSSDQGNNWKKIESDLIASSVVTGLGFNKNNELFAFVIPTTEDNSQQEGLILKSDKSMKNWTEAEGQIPDVKAAWKFASGPDNNELYAIVSQQTSENDIASNVYKTLDNSISWVLEGTNRDSISQSR